MTSISTDSINMAQVILALLSGIFSSVITIFIKNWLDRKSAALNSKKQLFRTLWKTRVQPLSPDHVAAINMIPLEFYGQKDITTKWKQYFEHLNQEIAKYPTGEAAWHEKRLELMYLLLAAIAKELKYNDIDEVEMKKGYTPQAHALIESDQITIQAHLAGVLRGERAIPVEIHYPKDPITDLPISPANLPRPLADLRTTGANSVVSTATTTSNTK